jgi:hypothetical protein
VEWSVFDTAMFHVLNSGEMNVFRLRFTVTPGPATMYFACALISAYPMAGSQPGGLSVFAAHPFVIRIIRDFHRSDVGATHRSLGTVNRHRLPRLCKKGGAELETIHQAPDQPDYRSCRRHLLGPAFSLSIHTLAAFDSNSTPGLNARIFQSDR